MNFNIDELKKKIIYRSLYRGTKEMDNLMSSFTKKIINNLNHQELVNLILEDSNYIKYIEEENTTLKNPERFSRIDNIKEFIESLKEFNNLEGFLEHVGLVMENISNTSEKSISLITMHSAKGLEFNYVFLSGWEEGVFPSKRSIEEFGNSGLEEERRLAYVAITRARIQLFITYVNQNRYNYLSQDRNIPSRFIDELPKDIIEIRDSSSFDRDDFINEFINNENNYNSSITPGRKRLLENSNKNEVDWDFNQDLIEDQLIVEGSKVFHKKYGYGKVLILDSDMAEVKFDKSSQKKVFMKYLQLAN